MGSDIEKKNSDMEKVHSYIREQFKIAAEQKKRCRETYPDWRDDEFNCADNLFCWGISYDSDRTPSFCTINSIQVYYNRQAKIYCLDIDSEISPTALKESVRKFTTYVALYNNEDCNKKLSLEEIGLDLFSAESLSNLLCKLKIFVNGYLQMREEENSGDLERCQ